MTLTRRILFPLCLAFIAADAHASLSIYNGVLSGANESPVVDSPGTGQVVLTYSSSDSMLRVVTSFSGLTGTVTAAHIHCCTSVAQPTAPVATMTPSFAGFPLGVTAGSYDHTFDMSQASSYNPSFITANGGTVAGANAALFAGLANGTAYFNIHTSLHPGGEIRVPLVLDTIFGNGFD